MNTILIAALNSHQGMDIANYIMKHRGETKIEYSRAMRRVVSDKSKYYIMDINSPTIRGLRADFVVLGREPKDQQELDRFTYSLYATKLSEDEVVGNRLSVWDENAQKLTTY